MVKIITCAAFLPRSLHLKSPSKSTQLELTKGNVFLKKKDGDTVFLELNSKLETSIRHIKLYKHFNDDLPFLFKNAIFKSL